MAIASLLVIELLSGVCHGLLATTRELAETETASPMDASWTGWFPAPESSASGGQSEDRHYGIMGAHCRNIWDAVGVAGLVNAKRPNCDNLQLYQGCSGAVPTNVGTEMWTGWYSAAADGSLVCQNGYIMTRMESKVTQDDGKASDMRLRCESVNDQFILGTSAWETIEFSDADSAQPAYMCSVAYGVVTGWSQVGALQKLQCASLVPKNWTLSPASFFWTSYFGSFETFSPSSHYPITGVRCQGGHCSKLSLYQATSGVDIEAGSLSYWTSAFSEEGNHSRECIQNYVVTRIKCMGDSCDNKMLQCSVINLAKNLMLTNEFISERFSEEGTSHMGQCRPDGYYLTGMQCFNLKCDNLKLVCKKVVRRTSTLPSSQLAPVGMWVNQGEYFKSFSRTSTLKICTQTQSGKQAEESETHSFANEVRTSLEIKYTVGSTLGLAETSTETTFGLAYSASSETASSVADTISSSASLNECRTEVFTCDSHCWTEMEQIQPGAASANLWQWWVSQQGTADPLHYLNTFIIVPEGIAPICPPGTQQIGDVTMTKCKPGTFASARRLQESAQWV